MHQRSRSRLSQQTAKRGPRHLPDCVTTVVHPRYMPSQAAVSECKCMQLRASCWMRSAPCRFVDTTTVLGTVDDVLSMQLISVVGW